MISYNFFSVAVFYFFRASIFFLLFSPISMIFYYKIHRKSGMGSRIVPKGSEIFV